MERQKYHSPGKTQSEKEIAEQIGVGGTDAGRYSQRSRKLGAIRAMRCLNRFPKSDVLNIEDLREGMVRRHGAQRGGFRRICGYRRKSATGWCTLAKWRSLHQNPMEVVAVGDIVSVK